MEKEYIKAANLNLMKHMLSLAKREGWEYADKLIVNSLSLIKQSKRLKNFENILLIGHGTSMATAMNSEYLFTNIANIPARAVYAYQVHRYPATYIKTPKKTLVIGISCSGNTESVRLALETAQNIGAATACISGSGEIKIAKYSDCRIITHTECEREHNLSAYSISHLFILLAAFRLAILCGTENATLTAEKANYWNKEMNSIFDTLSILPEYAKITEELVNFYKEQNYHHLVVLGTGPNMGTAQEAALKICEFAWIFGAAEELEDFAHGRFREMDEHIPLFIFAPHKNLREKTLDILAGCKVSNTPTFLFTEENSDVMKNMSTKLIPMPAIKEECLTPFFYVFMAWFFGYYYRAQQCELVGEKRFGLYAVDIDYKKYLKDASR